MAMLKAVNTLLALALAGGSLQQKKLLVLFIFHHVRISRLVHVDRKPYDGVAHLCLECVLPLDDPDVEPLHQDVRVVRLGVLYSDGGHQGELGTVLNVLVRLYKLNFYIATNAEGVLINATSDHVQSHSKDVTTEITVGIAAFKQSAVSVQGREDPGDQRCLIRHPLIPP